MFKKFQGTKADHQPLFEYASKYLFVSEDIPRDESWLDFIARRCLEKDSKNRSNRGAFGTEVLACYLKRRAGRFRDSFEIPYMQGRSHLLVTAPETACH
ncbi:MAG: hypothetical protein IPL87_00380 [Candidatus Moraniibacteriota bacterium]|nr:MAG: hypothetical protein IPL87_00380 [Candidatus Moranbacteria bacterium]